MPPRPGSDRLEPATIGHVVRDYLPRSETFIYATLCFQRAFAPVVYAKRTLNLAEFPLERVEGPPPPAPLFARANRRAKALLSGYRDTYSRRIAECATRDGCVALHAHFGWSGVAAVTAAARLEIPLITTFYGVDVSDGERAAARHPPYRRLFASGARFICEGPAMAAHLAAQGCPPDRIRIVRIGIDLDLWPFRPAVRRRPLIIAQACRFIDKKGADLSLRAYARARGSLGTSELWMIGDGPRREELEKLAERLGIAGHVRFTGMVSYADYRELLRSVHICVHPSRTGADGDTEGGAPTVLLEMQAAGIPVISTRHADIPTVVPDDRYLADEEDVQALADLLVRVSELDDATWQAQLARSRSFVEREHDASALAAEIEAVYREAIGQDALPAPA